MGTALATVLTVWAAATQAQTAQQPSTEVLELRDAERLFDAFEFPASLVILDQLASMLDAGRPDQRDILARVYELSARARFNLQQTEESNADFEALLRIVPNYRLAQDISPRVIQAFDAIRTRIIGVLEFSMDPLGEVAVDGEAPVLMIANPWRFEFTEGRHTLTASLPGYQEETREFTVVPEERVVMSVELIRIFGTVEITTVPPGTIVFVDNEPAGVTEFGARSDEPSLPLNVPNLRPGSHTLRLEHDCYKPKETSFIMLDPPIDLSFDNSFELEPAVATAVIKTSAPDAVVYLDGERRGAPGAPVEGICEGDHVLEVRSPAGRFVDRRTWRADETVTIDAALRKAFAIIDTGGTGTLNAALAVEVEMAVGDAQGTMIYLPVEAERTAASGVGGSPADPSLTVAQRRTLGKEWADHLDAQGLAWLSLDPAAGSDAVRLSLLAVGSGLPDVLPLRLLNLESHMSAASMLGAAPPVIRASLEASLVDVDGVTGAAVIRVTPGGTSERAGLAVGDVIWRVDQIAMTSASDVRRAIDRSGPSGRITLTVASAQGERTIAVQVVGVPNAISPADRSFLSNTLLLAMQDAVAAADTTLADAAARLNLAIAHIRLTNWDHAQRELEQVSLPDGPGVSAGTVHYLMGLCLIGSGQLTAAQAAFRRAAAAPDSLLFIGGPPVAALAHQQLDEMTQ